MRKLDFFFQSKPDSIKDGNHYGQKSEFLAVSVANFILYHQFVHIF